MEFMKTPIEYRKACNTGKTLKIRAEYFQPIIDGRKPFEVRRNNRNFESGEIYILREVSEIMFYTECKYYGNCEYRDNAVEEGYGEEEAIDMCGKTARKHCYEHKVNRYSGREALIKIKDIFNLNGAELEDYVAFTFDILWTNDETSANQ